jgi:hypothetical protein
MKAHLSVRSRRALLALTLLGASACATTSRLDIGFDADPVNTPPAPFPAPNPPNDSIATITSEGVTATVVDDPAGGRWLRLTPQPSFVADPDRRRRAVLATSAAFTTSPPANVRGSMRMRLDGPGTVTIGLRPAQAGGASPDFIGGIAVGNYLPGVPSQAYVVPGFTLARVTNDVVPLNSAGTMASPPAGTAFNVNWSIDQASRTLSASVNGGPPISTTFPAISAGVATTPIVQLSLWVWMEKVGAPTAFFIDNLRAEEYR